jgi:hypothetical protein
VTTRCQATATRLPQDLKRRAAEHAGDDEADDHVRPRRAAERDGQRREEHADVADDIVAGARPGRAHIDVVAAMPPEQDGTDDVGGERRHAHDADDVGRR